MSSAGQAVGLTPEDTASRLLKAMFHSLSNKYRIQIKHDHEKDKDDFQIPVTMSGDTDAAFPCELHELSFVFPNTTFRSAGTSFLGRSALPSLKGQRIGVTGITEVVVDKKVLHSMPAHSYEFKASGTITLECKDSSHASSRLVYSEPPSLFAYRVVDTLLREMVDRIAWVHTDRTGCRRSLKATTEVLRSGSLNPSERSLFASSSKDHVVPYEVNGEQLSFSTARSLAAELWKELSQEEQRMYKQASAGADLTEGFLDNDYDWGDRAVRQIVETRMKAWQAAAVDTTEQPFLREQKAEKRARRFASKGDDAISIGQDTVSQYKERASVSRQARANELRSQTETRQTKELKTFKNVKRHLFFHPVNEDPAAEWSLDWMLIQTTVSFYNQRQDRDLEEAEDAKERVKTLIRNNHHKIINPNKIVAAAMSILSAMLDRVPVYNLETYDQSSVNSFAIGTKEFRRLVYLIKDRAVTKAFAALVTQEKTVEVDETTRNALELLSRMRQVEFWIRQRNLTLLPEYEALKSLLSQVKRDSTMEKLALKENFDPEVQRGAGMIQTDGRLNINARVSSYGEDINSLHNPSAFTRLDLAEAVKRAVLRLFYDPNVAEMKRYFAVAAEH